MELVQAVATILPDRPVLDQDIYNEPSNHILIAQAQVLVRGNYERAGNTVLPNEKRQARILSCPQGED